MKIGRTFIAFLLSSVSAFLLASFFHTQNILQRLTGLGVDISLSDRATSTLRDMMGLKNMYLPVIMVTLLLGFIVAYFLKRRLTALATIAYPLAGALAIATMLTLMHINFEITPIAGARGAIGFSLQMLAGAIGGFLFSSINKQKPV